MGLKQDVVIVNEYSIPLPFSRKEGGPRGSRGGTPGSYVLRYMARETATETITPIRRHHTDIFDKRYRSRENAVKDTDVGDLAQLKSLMVHAQGLGGVAFGYGEFSLSHDQLKAAADDVQSLFDSGHTVMKTVISFTPEYLKRYGLIPASLDPRRRGDYRGNLDQLKLRMALIHGLQRMGGAHYDELRYVGVIQVDTEYVHCHLAMVDAGRGTRVADGTQKGKISKRAKFLLRRGIDTFLERKNRVKHLSSSVGYEKRNVDLFVKRWLHQQILNETLPQFLIACLPEDRQLWRRGTDRPEMRKPDRVIREVVEEVLDQPDSSMGAVMNQEHTVRSRLWNKVLRTRQQKSFGRYEREEIIEQGISVVYTLLRQIPQDELHIRTPMLDVMSMDYEDLAVRAHKAKELGTDTVSFGFRLRSYSTRLDHHTEQRERAHRRVREWEFADSMGMASDASRSLYHFWQEEEEYHARVSAKYRSFLPFTPPTTTWYEPWEHLASHHKRLLSLESMLHDPFIRKTKDPDEAERIGREVYGHEGGHLLSLGDAASLTRFKDRIHTMRMEYIRKLMDLRVELAGQGLVLEVLSDDIGQVIPRVKAGTEYPFEDVKGLDLHHLIYDFHSDVEIGGRARAAFVNWAQRRSKALNGALAYLEGSGQAKMALDLPFSDVRSMVEMARKIESEEKMSMLPSGLAKLANERKTMRRSATVSLSQQLSKKISRRVNETVKKSVPTSSRGDNDLYQNPLQEPNQ